MQPPYFLQPNLIILLMAGLCIHMVCSQSQVEYLPGFPGKLPFRLETGYIGVGESEEIQLFYYFIESERSPQNDPLLLWLQGGPGCSVFSGLVLEMGPLTFDYSKTNNTIPELILKPYSWTKLSNVVFLDQPVGTGFSYAKSPEAYNFDEASSAKIIYEFLRKWLLNHPNFRNNPFYIAGESFTGLVIPQVVDHIYNGIKAGSEPHFNMKGYILGNPFTYLYNDLNGQIPYAHRMGLLSDKLYKSAKENCKGNYLNPEPDNYPCIKDMERVSKCIEKIEIYNILEPSCDLPFLYQMPPEYEINARRVLQSSTPKSWCRFMDYIHIYKWANIKLVQKALHIREGTKTEWVRCNYTIKSESYTNNIDSVVDFHKKFLDQTDGRALIFSGDHDMAAPHSATERWINSLNLQIKSDWRPWFVAGQIAGYTTAYVNGESELTYATVKGAGHTAAEYKPMECFSMIERWLSHNPL